MEQLYRNYSVVDTLSKSSIKTVEIAKLKLINKTLPNLFIVKHFARPEPPNEFLIHEKLSNFDHNILKLHSSWQTSEEFFMCVEHCKYLDLSNYFTKMPHGPEYFSKILQSCIQLALNLNTMHNLKITHNDLNLSKVLINEEHVFKLSGFSSATEHCYSNLSIKNKGRFSLNTSLSLQMKSFDYSPYEHDIKNLGIVFIEILLFRRCPEIEKKTPDKVRSYLNKIYSNFNFDNRFLELILKMISNEQSPKLSIQEIVENLFIMYKECKFDEGNHEPVLQQFNVDPADITINLHSERNTEKPMQDSNPEIILEENTSSSKVNFTYYSEDDISYESTELIDKNLKSTKRSLQENVEVKENEVNLTSELSLSNSKSILVSKDEGEESKSNISELIPERNSVNSPSSEIIHKSSNLSDSIQVFCYGCENNSSSNGLIMLPCKHYYHRSCLKNKIEQYLLQYSRKKSAPIKCYVQDCEGIIGFDYLYHQEILSLEFKKLSLMQLYANLAFYCRDCERIIEGEFLLSDKLKRLNRFCKGCKRNHCNFCGALGGHRFSCDLFQDFNKGVDNFDSYSQYIENFNKRK